MGKIKERRFRYHAKLVKASVLNAAKNENKQDEKIVDVENQEMPLSTTSNIFEGTEINLDKILGFAKKDTDNRSVSGVSKKELKKDEQVLSKKDKIKLRREKFLQKLEVMYAEKKPKKKKKKRVQAFDMVPFLVSLPSTAETAEKPQPLKKKPSRISMKAKQRLKENLKDFKHFQRILNDTTFAKNPTSTITEFLKQKVASKRPDLQLDE